MRVFWLALSDGALYSSGKNLLADRKEVHLENAEGALASQGYSSSVAGMAEACSRGAREASWRGEIRVDDGGEATGLSALRLRGPPSTSGGASCRTEGARLPPFPWAPSWSASATIVQHLRQTVASRSMYPLSESPDCVFNFTL